MSKVVYEGWMVRYGRRKIGRSYIHMRYFVLEPRLLAYYKKEPQDNQLPIKTMVIDGNCRVEDRGLKTHHGHMVYELSVYNKKEKHNEITMAAFNIQEALMWKEKIECVIDQHQESGMDVGRTASSSDHKSPFSALEDEDDARRDLMRSTTIGNGPPESILDWTKEFDTELSNQNSSNQALSRKHWRLLQCQNGLQIFEELLEVDYLPRSCSRATKAVGVVDATCEEIFELVMSMDATRYEWDCSFQYGRLVEEVDGHTAILYHRLLLDWFPMVVWPRDLCYVRYWRRNDDGSYVVLFRSREHENCGPQPGFVRAHLESGGFNITPLKPRKGRPRTQVQYLIQIDLKGWGAGYIPAFQQHCLLQMLNSISGLREWFSRTDDRGQPIRIPVMVNMASSSLALDKGGKPQHKSSLSIDQTNGASRNSALMDEDSDDVDEFQLAESDHESPGDGRAIHRIVETTPKVHEYIPGERTENPRDKVTEFPTGKFGANHERPSSDAKTNDNFLDRPFTYSPKHNKVKPPNIQVFINFRGDQLRKYFISYLADALRKREINVFIDTKANIGDDLINLFLRIDDSGIAIVVFSSRYTESEWCLDELVRIKERAHQGLLKVLPIFYKVTPGNVKRLKGEFGDNFRDKEHTYASDESKIKQWKDAIVFVSHKFALTFDEKSSELEIDFIETIIKEVLKMLQYLVESGESSR